MIETVRTIQHFLQNRDKGEKQMIKDMQPFLQQAWENLVLKS